MADFDGIIDPPAGDVDVPQLSTEAVAMGGLTGAMNAQARALVAREKQLRADLANGEDAGKGAGMVGFLAGITSAKKRTLLGKNRESLSVQDFGAIGGGDLSTSIQRAFNAVDAHRLPSIKFPTVDYDYFIDSPVSLTNPGVLIHGDKGPTYNRGNGKLGNIRIGVNAYCGFDLGNNSTDTTNPADMWAVSRIGFLQGPGVPAKTKYGIAITRQTNGPDRGAIFTEISCTGLAAGIYIPPANANVKIQLANLVIENSCLSNNKYGVYSEGKVWGLRFVGNQAEQNNTPNASGDAQTGAIHGDFQGGITINDNMLEGQPNAINISASSGGMDIESQRNYFETNNTNGSAYVYSLETTAGVFLRSTATIGPNYRSGNKFPTDYLRIKGRGSWKLTMNDPFPVVFCNWSGAIMKGSNIFPGGIDYYNIRGLDSRYKTPEIFINNGLNRFDASGLWGHVKFSSGIQVNTPLGDKFAAHGGESITIPLAINKDDLIVINVMVLAKNRTTAANVSGTLITPNDAFFASLGPSYIDEISGGEWCLVSLPFISSVNLSSFKFRYSISNGSMDVLIAGISYKNFGSYVNDGSEVASISPVAPNLV